MDFSEALRLLKAGKKVRRERWVCKAYLKLFNKKIFVYEEKYTGFHPLPQEFSKLWEAPSDILLAHVLADDWEEIE